MADMVRDMLNRCLVAALFAVPILVFLLWRPAPLDYAITFVLYCIVGITDYFDGYLARAVQGNWLTLAVVKVEPLASAVPADLAAWLGPTLQRYFTDPAVTAADDGQTELR